MSTRVVILALAALAALAAHATLAAPAFAAGAAGKPGAPPPTPAPAVSASAAAPRILDVVAERAVLHPGVAGETAAWRYRTSVPSRVTASIYDPRDLLVRTLVSKEQRPAGDQRLTWDGRDDSGRAAPAGYYLLVLESTVAGATAVYDPSETTGGEPTQATAARYDREAGLVRYAITKPALLRVQLGLRNDGPLLRTLADWVARDAGEQAEPWDGWDSSGVIRFGDSPSLDVQVWAYSLPVNAVVVAPPKPAAPAAAAAAKDGQAPPASIAPASRPVYLDFPKDRPRRAHTESRPHEMYNHWQHDRLRCHNPTAVLRLASGAPRGSGPVTVEAPLPLRLELPAEEAAFVQDERFETVIYVDGVFAFEEEQGYLPFTWTLEPGMLTRGDHVVTFMVRGYEGHFGSSSIRVSRPDTAGSAAVGR